MGNCCGGHKQAIAAGRPSTDHHEPHPFHVAASAQDDKTSLVRTVHTNADFQAAVKEAGTKLVILDFYATWCGPCRTMAPKIEDLAGQFPDVVFLKADVDENEEVAAKYSVTCMPTFIFIKNGEKTSEFSGANADKLKELVEKNK